MRNTLATEYIPANRREHQDSSAAVTATRVHSDDVEIAIANTLGKYNIASDSNVSVRSAQSYEPQSRKPSVDARVNINLLNLVSRKKLNPAYAAKPVAYVVLQEWEGVVDKVEDNHFWSLLADITAGKSRLSEQARIENSEVGKQYLDRVKPGAVFRWLIGYQTDPNGERQRFSRIVFRDLPRFTKRDREEAVSQAEEFLRTVSPLE